MPEGGGHESTAGNRSLHPTVFEEAGGEKGLGDSGPTKNGGDAAADPLVERSPGDIELRALARIEGHAGGSLGSLPEEIECVAHLVQRHFLFAGRMMRGRIGSDRARDSMRQPQNPIPQRLKRSKS